MTVGFMGRDFGCVFIGSDHSVSGINNPDDNTMDDQHLLTFKKEEYQTVNVIIGGGVKTSV